MSSVSLSQGFRTYADHSSDRFTAVAYKRARSSNKVIGTILMFPYYHRNMVSDESLPDWWEKNQKIRESMDLPKYQPPRFKDGIYTHKIISDLEDELGATPEFRGYDTRYPDDFSVVLEGDNIFKVKRKRNNKGNTIYEITSDKFKKKVIKYVENEKQKENG